MPDIVLNQGESVPQAMETTYAEQADGTHALRVATGGSPTDGQYFQRWDFLGGQTINGGVSTSATMPAGTTIVEIRAENEDVYFEINAINAAANSPGFVPTNGAEIIGPLDNLNELTLLSAAGGRIHLLYFQETGT